MHDPAVREHVSLYFYEHPERYRVVHLERSRALATVHGIASSSIIPKTLQFITEVYRRLAPDYGETLALTE